MPMMLRPVAAARSTHAMTDEGTSTNDRAYPAKAIATVAALAAPDAATSRPVTSATAGQRGSARRRYVNSALARGYVVASSAYENAVTPAIAVAMTKLTQSAFPACPAAAPSTE